MEGQKCSNLHFTSIGGALLCLIYHTHRDFERHSTGFLAQGHSSGTIKNQSNASPVTVLHQQRNNLCGISSTSFSRSTYGEIRKTIQGSQECRENTFHLLPVYDRQIAEKKASIPAHTYHPLLRAHLREAWPPAVLRVQDAVLYGTTRPRPRAPGCRPDRQIISTGEICVQRKGTPRIYRIRYKAAYYQTCRRLKFSSQASLPRHPLSTEPSPLDATEASEAAGTMTR